MMPNDTATPKDAAFRAIGRAVVNFRRLEHNLKLAARFTPLEGVAAKIQKDIERRVEKAQSLTLGQAIQEWLFAINGDPGPCNPTPDMFDMTIRMSISLDPSSEHATSHAEKLKWLLGVRNALIHGVELVKFDWDSPTECIRLIEELNAVCVEIGVQVDFVAAVLKSLTNIGPDDVVLVHGIEDVPQTATTPPTLNLCKCRTPPFLFSDFEIVTLGADARHSEVSLHTCRHCGSVWLNYLVEDPGRTAAGRWWRVVIPDDRSAAITADNARDFIQTQTAGYLGGSHFQSAGKAFKGRPNIF